MWIGIVLMPIRFQFRIRFGINDAETQHWGER
jgi:hypothetical protein